MNNIVITETERLILRRWDLEDVDEMVEGLNNLNVSKWLSAVPYPYTKEDAIKFVNKTIEDDLYNLAIVLKDTNKVIGGTQISFEDKANGISGGGIWLNESYWGKGYGTEAFKAKIKYTFDTFNIRKIENGYFKGNEPSHQMQLKIGFKDEGIKREHFISKATGIVHDECITGLLKEEFKS